MINQFDKYYKGLIQFLIENNIANKSDFQGLSQAEIINLEKFVGVMIPAELKCYLSYFGQRMNLNHLGVSKYTMNSIVKAEEVATQKQVKARIRNSEMVDVWSEKSTKGKLDKIIIIGYLETTNYFTLISGCKAESSLFGWDGELNYKFNTTIFGELRRQIYNGLKRICEIRKDKSNLKPNTYSMDVYQNTKNINTSKIDWLNIYESNYVSNNHLVTSIHSINETLFKSQSETKQFCAMEEFANLVAIELNKQMKTLDNNAR